MASKRQLAQYAGASVVPLVDPLVQLLLREQPDDPAAFAAEYFQRTLGSGRGAAPAPAATPAAPALQELQARIAALELENKRLQVTMRLRTFFMRIARLPNQPDAPWDARENDTMRLDLSGPLSRKRLAFSSQAL